MTAKERYYYTFKPKNDGSGKWDVLKWDQLGDESVPEATYVVDPSAVAWRGECTCEAWTTCKHIKCVQEKVKAGLEQELPFLKWDMKNGWREIEL